MSGPTSHAGASLIGSTTRMGVNTHVHLPPNFSAFGTTAEAVERAAVEGLAVLGASNYYDFAAYREFEDLAREAGVYPLFGMEAICYLPELRDAGVKINDPGNPGKMYVCGKGLSHWADPSAEADRLLGVLRGVDGARTAAQVERMDQVFVEAGIDLAVTVDAVVEAVARRAGVPPATVHLQERHVAQAFADALTAVVGPDGLVEALTAVTGASSAASDPVSVQNYLRATLMKAGKRAYVAEEDAISFELVRALVLELGGILCYPILADGASPVCAFEQPVQDLAAWLSAHGVHAAEMIPNRNDPEVLARYVEGLRAAGIVVTAGTEHNTLDMVAMEPVCLDGSQLPGSVQAVAWEGACVVAAHQHAVTHGEQGFVGPDGVPDPTYADADERIRAWAARGEKLIHAYREEHATTDKGEAR